MDIKARRTIVIGATGFIGKAFCCLLVEDDYEVVVLSRSLEKVKETFGDRVSGVKWDGKTSRGWEDSANRAFAIINLAGENLAQGRWTKKKKQSILESRLNAGQAVVEAVKSVPDKPKVLIQASAIGYYGSRQDEPLDEFSSPGEGFLSQVVQQWELSTQEVESLNVRRIICRSGLALGKEGGALPRLLLPFRFFVGGPLGRGKQWFSWIHLQDEVRAIRFLMERRDLSGVFNLASPNPLRQKDFSRILGKVMKRPSWLPLPAPLFRLFLGEKAKETLLSSQKVVPNRLLEAGFKFLFPDLELALREILD